jgi:hypothetical protein
MPSRGARGLLALLAGIAALLQPVYAIDAKCSACVAVATQLQSALEAERPRNHLDMRGRLDSKGVRYGKLIDYKVSELRFVELLENLCDDVGDKFGFRDGSWTAGAKSAGSRAERKALRKELEGYCHRLVEAQEEHLQEALYAGTLENESVEELMCRAYAPRDCEGEPTRSDNPNETVPQQKTEKEDL